MPTPGSLLSKLLFFFVSITLLPYAHGTPGDWPEPRQNAQLTAAQSLPGAMSEAPRLIARYDLGRSAPAVQTVLLPEGSGAVGLCLVGGALFCYDAEGKERWRSHPMGLHFTRIAAAEDLNEDGIVEVLLTAGRTAEPYGAAVLLSLTDGRVLWRYDVEPMSYCWYLFADHYFPDTTTKQILVLMQGYPPDKKNGYVALFAFADSEIKQRWRYDFSEYTCFPSLLQTDLEGDGAKEIVVETHSRMWFLDALSGVMKQFISWDVSPANIRSYGYIKFLDLNGDQRDDFLCIANFAQHHEVLINHDGRLEKAWHYGWPESVTTGKVATTWPEPPYADVDGGAIEIVVSMFNGDNDRAWQVRLYDAVTGAIKLRIPGLIAERCLDADGDGRAELLCNATDDPSRNHLNGARLIKPSGDSFKTLWQNDSCTAVSGSESGAPIRKHGEPFTLVSSGDIITLSPWKAPENVASPTSIAVPAIQGPALPTLLAADANSDGQNELILFDGKNIRVLQFQKGEFFNAGEYASSSIPLISDLNSDGKNELILSAVSAAGPPTVEALTPALENKMLWRTVFPEPGRPGLPQPRLAYLRTIRAMGKTTPDVYVWAGTPIVRSALLEGTTGTLLWDKGETPGLERYWGPSVNFAAVWDFNADGREDLVFTNPDYFCIADGPTGNPLFGPAFPPDIFHQPSQGLYTYPAILDEKEGEATICLAAGHYFQAAMSLHAVPYWYKTPEPGENRCAMEAFLREKDGKWRMGFGRQNGRFACVQIQDGSVRWELPIDATCSDVVTGDVDGDQSPEFVFGTSHGQLYAVGDGAEGPRTVWKVEYPSGLGSPILADINGDGRVEIIAASVDGYVNVWGSANKP